MPDDDALASTAPAPPTAPKPSTTPARARSPLLATSRHLDAIRDRAAVLAEHAASAGWDADVPTCPRWTVADLVAHQGMVHRWAAANLRGDDTPVPSKTEVLRDVPRPDLLRWFTDGAEALLATFAATPDDVAATVFLNDAPPPRAFWARRQAHEVTIHAADALAAELGRYPTADEVGVDRDHALDGIDELLRGFFTRGRAGLAGGDPFTVAVRPSDADAEWLLHVGTERIVTERTTRGTTPGTPDDPATVFTGTAAQLYLGLWNRGTEIGATGRTEVLDRWHEVQRVRWS